MINFKNIICTTIFLTTIIHSIGFFQISQAQVTTSNTQNNKNLIERLKQIIFKRRKNTETKKYPKYLGSTEQNRKKAVARTNQDCPEESCREPIIVLVPPKYKTNQNEYCLCQFTVSEYPTFWLYIPSSIPANSTIIFQLRRGEDQKSVLVDKKPIEFSLSKNNGIIGFQLPYSQKPLDTNKYYSWYFKILFPKDKKMGEPLELFGWIERIEDNYSLGSTTMENLGYSYASNGIWSDALTQLAKLRYQNPTNSQIEENWKSLLRSADNELLLQKIADKPILNYYTAENDNHIINHK